MRTTPVPVPRAAVERRKRLGLDFFDEVWEGVYQVVPSPDWDHQMAANHLAAFLDDHCVRHRLGRANGNVNVRQPGTGARNYRVPDVVFVSKRRLSIVQGTWVEGGPDVVFEIRSPRDDTYKKFRFYAMLGVPTLVVRNGRRGPVEVYRLERGSYVLVELDKRGRVRIDSLGVALRAVRKRGKPAVEVRSTRGDGAVLVV